MITRVQLAIAVGIFGFAVVAGGLSSKFVEGDSSSNGLYFGLALGGIALLGAALAGFNLVLIGRIVAEFAAGVAVWWFSRQLYEGLGENFRFGFVEIRKAIVVVLGVATAVVSCLPLKKPANQ